MPNRADLTNQRFGRLKVLSFSHMDKDSNRHWLCVCTCGNRVTAPVGRLRAGKVKSCGCLRVEHVRRMNAAGLNHRSK